MRSKLALAVLIEFSYAVFTRTWLREHTSELQLELTASALRLATATAYWFLFRELILCRRPNRAALGSPLLLLGVIPLLLVPFLFDGGLPSDKTLRAVLALTSVVVAVREEWLYRGVLQNILERHLGWLPALLLSNVVFTLYHYGAQPFTLPGLVELFAMGCVLGLIYFRSGSILAAIALHATYDAAWSAGPLIQDRLNDLWRIAFYLVGAMLIGVWVWQSSDKRFQPTGSRSLGRG